MSGPNFNDTTSKPITTTSFINILAPTTSLLSIVVEPSDGESCITDAINALSAAGGGTVQLTSGIYEIHNGIWPNVGINNVTIRGLGDTTILQYDGSLVGPSIYIKGVYVQSEAINSIVKDGVKITFTDPADATGVLLGDRIWIEGTDSNGETDVEWNIASGNGNGTTGEVYLQQKVSRTMTGVMVTNMRGCSNIQFRDFKMTTVGTPSPYSAIKAEYNYNCTIDSVTFENWDGSSDCTILERFYGIENKVTNCRFKDIKAYCVVFQSQIGAQARFNRGYNIFYDAALYQGGLIYANVTSYDCQYTDNFVNVSGQRGISQSIDARRTQVCRNTILNTLWEAIYCGANESVVTDNIIENCLQSGALMISENNFAKNSIVSKNFVKNCYHGVYTYKPQGINISGNEFIDCLGSGVIIQGGTSNQISNNIIRNSQGSAIYLGSVDGVDSTKNTVAINTIDTVIEKDGFGNGIRLADGSDDNTIIGNTLTSTTQAAIRLDLADNNEIVGNSFRGLGKIDSGASNDWGHNKE